MVGISIGARILYRYDTDGTGYIRALTDSGQITATANQIVDSAAAAFEFPAIYLAGETACGNGTPMPIEGQSSDL